MHYSGYVITDVTVTQCSSLNPFSSCKLDPAVWYRIEKDLYLRTGWTSTAYIQFQRKKEEGLGGSTRWHLAKADGLAPRQRLGEGGHLH